jgi:hypothetical protein
VSSQTVALGRLWEDSGRGIWAPSTLALLRRGGAWPTKPGLPVIHFDESEEITVAVRADDLLEGDTADPEQHPIALAIGKSLILHLFLDELERAVERQVILVAVVAFGVPDLKFIVIGVELHLAA